MATLNKRLEYFLDFMKPGQLYGLDDLSQVSRNPSRDLKKLLDSSLLVKAAPGLYYKPKMLGELKVPANKHDLVKKFLGVKSGTFHLRNLSDFNTLRLGTTQHSKKVYVYNKKRSGEITLDGRLYDFRVRKFPKKPTPEYLLVDMLNSMNELGEEPKKLLENLKRRLPGMELDKDRLLETSEKYGASWVKMFFRKMEREDALPT